MANKYVKTDKVYPTSLYECYRKIDQAYKLIEEVKKDTGTNPFDNYFYRNVLARNLIVDSGVDISYNLYEDREGPDSKNDRTELGENKSCMVRKNADRKTYSKSASFLFCKQDEKQRREESLCYGSYTFIVEDKDQMGDIPLVIYLNTDISVKSFKDIFLPLQQDFIKKKAEWDAKGEAMKWDAVSVKLKDIIYIPEARYISKDAREISKNKALDIFGFSHEPEDNLFFF